MTLAATPSKRVSNSSCSELRAIKKMIVETKAQARVKTNTTVTTRQLAGKPVHRRVARDALIRGSRRVLVATAQPLPIPTGGDAPLTLGEIATFYSAMAFSTTPRSGVTASLSTKRAELTA